jgi:hypothetical protein
LDIRGHSVDHERVFRQLVLEPCLAGVGRVEKLTEVPEEQLAELLQFLGADAAAQFFDVAEGERDGGQPMEGG